MLAIYVISVSWINMNSEKPIGKLEKITGGMLVGFAHFQLLVGLALYFFYSPDIKAAFENFGIAMKDSALRMKVLEHPLVGIIGVVLIQVGRSLSKKATEIKVKRRKMALFTSIALLLIISRIPNW